MNLSWLKRHLVVLIFVTAFVAILGLIIWLERTASDEEDSIEAELADQQEQLQAVQSHNPYPSSENIKALNQDRQQLQDLFNSLRQELSGDSVPEVQLDNEIDFSQRLRVTLQDLGDAASKANVTTPPDFAYGFSRYVAAFPCRNPPAKPEDCQRVLALLAKQLAVAEKLSLMAITNGVDAITEVHRTEVEPGPPSGDALPVPIVHDPKALYDSMPFELQFVCSPVALQAFLNSLSRSDWFFAVKTLKITTESVAGTTPVPEQALLPGQAPVATPKVPARTRLVVTVRIDLVEFPNFRATPQNGN